MWSTSGGWKLGVIKWNRNFHFLFYTFLTFLSKPCAHIVLSKLLLIALELLYWHRKMRWREPLWPGLLGHSWHRLCPLSPHFSHSLPQKKESDLISGPGERAEQKGPAPSEPPFRLACQQKFITGGLEEDSRDAGLCLSSCGGDWVSGYLIQVKYRKASAFLLYIEAVFANKTVTSIFILCLIFNWFWTNLGKL